MKNTYLILTAAVIFLIIGVGIWHFSQHTNAAALERFSGCGSLANGSTQTVTETSRAFINLPKDLYPDVNLQITSHGATAGSISNGGPYGSAIGGQGKPNCWSYYFEFDGIGTVDLTSKSGTSGTPDYAVHFVVTSARSTQPQACTQEAKQCPDGSYVGRTGPNCAFAACPNN